MMRSRLRCLGSFTLALGLTASFTPTDLWAQGRAAKAGKAAEETAGGPAKGSIVEDRAARKLLEAGDSRLEADEHSKAIEVWQSVIERYPRSRVKYDAHMRLGKQLLQRERAYDRARTHF